MDLLIRIQTMTTSEQSKCINLAIKSSTLMLSTARLLVSSTIGIICLNFNNIFGKKLRFEREIEYALLY